MIIYLGEELPEAMKEKTYQNPFPEKTKCSKCSSDASPFLLIDDEDGELVAVSPKRKNGYPIFPHDSCAFCLYMCEKCGNVETEWNQA